MSDSTITFEGSTFDVLAHDIDYGPLPESYVHTVLGYARDTQRGCVYHRKRLERAGIGPQGLDTLEDFWRIPPMTHRDVNMTPPLHLLPDTTREALAGPGPASLVGDDRIVRVSQSTTSSGGNPKLSYYTKADWDASCSLTTRLHRSLPAADCSRVFNCFHPGHGAGRYFVEALGRNGSLLLNRHHAATTIEEIVDQMTHGFAELGGFNCIAAPPFSPNPRAKGVTLDALLNADLDNFIGRKIRVIISAGAPLDAPALRLRDRVAEANELAGTEPTLFSERYGSAEVGIAASSCEDGHLHLFYGPVYAEVIDPGHGRPVADGERGRLAFTAVRHGSRYLRYLVGDEATVRRQPCSCGRTTPRLEDIRRVVEVERLKRGCAAGAS